VSDGHYANGFFDGVIVRIVGYRRWHDDFMYVFKFDNKEYSIIEHMLEEIEVDE
jgi:hypothetical protein